MNGENWSVCQWQTLKNNVCSAFCELGVDSEQRSNRLKCTEAFSSSLSVYSGLEPSCSINPNPAAACCFDEVVTRIRSISPSVSQRKCSRFIDSEVCHTWWHWLCSWWLHRLCFHGGILTNPHQVSVMFCCCFVKRHGWRCFVELELNYSVQQVREWEFYFLLLINQSPWRNKRMDRFQIFIDVKGII